jgi:Putative DNA-binding domain
VGINIPSRYHQSCVQGDAALRLGVYRHAYRAQLLECLRDTYERVWAWLGDERFDTAAHAYIEASPPRSWTLGEYGWQFDQLLGRLYPSDPEVAELAWLDGALRRAFDGPDSTPVEAAACTGVDWDRAVLYLTPTLRMTSISTNAPAIWAALSEGRTPPAASLLQTAAALRVWRLGSAPNFRTVDPLEQQALVIAASGESFATICSALAARQDITNPDETAGTLLAAWLRDGLITGIVESCRVAQPPNFRVLSS